MKGKDISFVYTDKNGKEVKLSQNGRTGGIMVASKLEEDITIPLGKVARKGEWHMEFHAMGSGEDAIHYDEKGLIDWYENEYQKLKQMIDEMDWDDKEEKSSQKPDEYER